MEGIIFIGIQGAGKSTFYFQNFWNSHLRISLDLLNTRKKEAELLKWSLEWDQKCVIDNTNPLPEDRARYIARFKHNGFKIRGYFFDISLEEALERNEGRPTDHKVPKKGIYGTFNKIKSPEYMEGFDTIYRVTSGNTSLFDVGLLSPGQ